MTPIPLLTSVNSLGHVHLVVGDNNGIAAKRARKSLESGASCILFSPTDVEQLHFELRALIDDKRIVHVQREFEENDLCVFGRQEVDRVVDMVFVTLPPHDIRTTWIASLCKRRRIPVNCVDSPENCTFSLLSTYRDGPLQIGVSTSGKVSPPKYILTEGV